MTGAPAGAVYPDRMGMLSSAFTVGSDSGTSSHFCKECEMRYLRGLVGGTA